MWEIDLQNQLTTFFLSLPLGFLLGAVFYFLEGLGLTSKSRKFRQFLWDIVFFLLSGFLTFCFLLARCNGEIRGYVIIGELIGFWIYGKLFGRITAAALKWLTALVSALVSTVFGTALRAVCKMCAFLRSFFEKVNIFSKKRLKNQDGLVYTETNNTEECER